MQFSGSIVASITPFDQGKIDEQAVHALIDFHVRSGTRALVACGCTGEAALLTRLEWEQMVSACITASAGRLPIIAGCGGPSTAEVVEMVCRAEALGACAALVITPYYVKPTPAGVLAHFEAIAAVSSLPLIVYNNPGRVGSDLSVETVVALSALPSVVGLKDSHKDAVTRLIQLRRYIQKPFSFLSGDDPVTPAYLACGGQGTISVTGNVVPQLICQLCEAWEQKDLVAFAHWRDYLDELNSLLHIETSPSPVKFAVSRLGLCKNELRLPLLPATLKTQQALEDVLTRMGGDLLAA